MGAQRASLNGLNVVCLPLSAVKEFKYYLMLEFYT